MGMAVASLDDGEMPIDNNRVANRIRPTALGRRNWLFACSLRDGRRAAAVTALIHSVNPNGIDPCGCIREDLERLRAQPAGHIAELLPHHWRACPIN